MQTLTNSKKKKKQIKRILIQERLHHVRVDVIVMTTHMKVHGNRSVIYKYNSSMSSSLLEGYKLSLKYITVIANCKNSLSVNLSQTFTLHSYLCSR